MKKQDYEEDDDEMGAGGPNWTLLIVAYFAVLSVAIVLLRPYHLSMGGIFFAMAGAAIALALLLFLVKWSWHKFRTLDMSAKDVYHLAIGYTGLPEVEEEEGEEEAPLRETGKGKIPPQETAPLQGEALFVTPREPEEVSTVPRVRLKDIIEHTALNSYQICLGRSLTKPGNPLVWVSFFMQHLKLIGASQYGKSSMATAILYLITRTHTPGKVLIALLDMEYKTSRLFSDLPHLALYTRADGQDIALHAKTKEQVHAYLGYLVAVMEDRYTTMSEEEVERAPIILVYVEEFLALKNYYKKQMSAVVGKEAKEVAAQDYADLIYSISELARRGLKVKIQLLLCAQVDYADKDLQEALINVASGMAFCVRVTAALAAGFYRTDLLNRNARENKKGQAVVEMHECSDLVLAPECNLRERLLSLSPQAAAAPQPQPSVTTKVLAPSLMTSGTLPITEAPTTPLKGESPAAAPPRPKGKTEMERFMEVYEAKPYASYREMGGEMKCGKDKIGELLKEAKERGLIQDLPDQK